MLNFIHEIRDPIHGFIKYNKLERDIIDSKPFQRLRYIKQLAFTDYVYPGASHTRFSHSLGVMEFATNIFETLIQKQAHKEFLKESLNWGDEEIQRNLQLLRLGALLHDVGHAPFSHAAEFLFMNGLRHEDYSENIILSTEIGEIIDKQNTDEKKSLGITKEEVASLISGRALGSAAFLREIISGQIDADRIDYLLRDSIYCGVDYGRFDYQRLIHTLTIIPEDTSGNPILAVEEGGVHTVEGLILARYFMFLQVYFHRVRRAYDIHLGDVLKEILPNGRFPENLDEYLTWDDVKVINLIREHSELEPASRILNRNHYRTAYSTGEHIEEPEEYNFYLILRQLREKFGEEQIHEDAAQTSLHKFGKVNLFIKVQESASGYLRIEERSRILKDFNKPINQRRILTDKNIKDEVTKSCRQIHEDFQRSRR